MPVSPVWAHVCGTRKRPTGTFSSLPSSKNARNSAEAHRNRFARSEPPQVSLGVALASLDHEICLCMLGYELQNVWCGVLDMCVLRHLSFLLPGYFATALALWLRPRLRPRLQLLFRGIDAWQGRDCSLLTPLISHLPYTLSTIVNAPDTLNEISGAKTYEMRIVRATEDSVRGPASDISTIWRRMRGT